jgi:hypothetical protein
MRFRVTLPQLLSTFAVDAPTRTLYCTLLFATWSITSLADFSVSFSSVCGSEYQAFSSVVHISSPPAPSPASEFVSPCFQVQGGGGGGELICTTEEKSCHSRYISLQKIYTPIVPTL